MNPEFTPSYLARQNEMLKKIFAQDADVLDKKEQTYKGSWRKRGGVGAFCMLARKWDRLENIAEAGVSSPTYPGVTGAGFDIFKILGIEDSKGLTGQDGSLLAEIRDLRRYLALVEAFFYIQKQAYPVQNPLPVSNPSYHNPPPMPLRGNQTSANIVEAERAMQGIRTPSPVFFNPDAQMEHAAANKG